MEMKLWGKNDLLQKLSMTERRGARASFKLSRKLPFIKKASLTLSGDDESKGKE